MEFLRNLATVDFDPKVFQQALDDADESLLAELDEIKGLFQEYSGTIPTFLDEFVSPQGTLAKKVELDNRLESSYARETDCRNRIQDFNAEIERLSRMLILKESDLKDLEMDRVQFKAQADSTKNYIMDLKQSLQQMEFDFSDASHSLEAEQSKVNEVLEKIDDAKNRKKEMFDDIRALKDEVDALNATIEEKYSQMQAQNSQFQDKFNRRQQLIGEIATGIETILACYSLAVLGKFQHIGTLVLAVELLNIVVGRTDRTEVIEPDEVRTPLPSLYVSEERCVGSLINHISITLQTGHESCL